MKYNKGKSGNPNGRPKGVTNKSTLKAREAIALFVDNNMESLQYWLDMIAKDDPKEAFRLFQSVIEYHIPKLARTDLQTLDGDGKPTGPIDKIEIELVSPKTTTT